MDKIKRPCPYYGHIFLTKYLVELYRSQKLYRKVKSNRRGSLTVTSTPLALTQHVTHSYLWYYMQYSYFFKRIRNYKFVNLLNREFRGAPIRVHIGCHVTLDSYSKYLRTRSWKTQFRCIPTHQTFRHLFRHVCC